MTAEKETEITRDEILSVSKVIRPYVRRTPVMSVNGVDFGLDPMQLSLKLELFQHSGSFKARGAFTNLLTREIPATGVVAASGGNHGAAVAYAGKRLGVATKIFVPRVASPAKIERMREYEADLVVTGERYDDALVASESWIQRSGALPIHAYDQRETLLGQGTLGEELESQDPAIDTLLVAVGGGGLIGGLAAWYRGKIKIIGVEPKASPTLYRALEAGAPVDAEAGGIAADSLAPRRVGSLMFPIAQRFLDRVLLVPDEAIQEAQSLLWRGMRIVAEPGGAAAFAAIASGRYVPEPNERVGVLVCGGNTTAVNF